MFSYIIYVAASRHLSKFPKLHRQKTPSNKNSQYGNRVQAEKCIRLTCHLTQMDKRITVHQLHNTTLVLTRYNVYVERNAEGLSRNHCYHGKMICITHSECVCRLSYPTHNAHAPILSLPYLSTIFTITLCPLYDLTCSAR